MIVAALRAVTKSFGATTALDRLDLELRAGEVLALLGPNGAGKTTAITILLGLRRPDSGRAELFGLDPRDVDARRRVGVSPQEESFPQTLRVAELVDLVRAHYAAPAATRDLLARFGLEEVARKQTGGLSGGTRRRLATALAFAGNPEAVFLDEPTAGLDVEARRDLWRVVGDYAATGGTVLLTTHHLEEAEALASRIVLLRRGRTMGEGTSEELKASAGLDAPARLEDAFIMLMRSSR